MDEQGFAFLSISLKWVPFLSACPCGQAIL